MRLISIGHIYLLKSSEAERRHTARWRSSETASPRRLRQNSALRCSAQSGHLADQQKYHSYVSVLLSKGAFKVSASNAPLHRHPLAFAHAQNALSYLPVSKNIPSSLSAPKASLVFARTQSGPSRLSASRALLCFGRAQSDPLRWPVSKSPS